MARAERDRANEIRFSNLSGRSNKSTAFVAGTCSTGVSQEQDKGIAAALVVLPETSFASKFREEEKDVGEFT